MKTITVLSSVLLIVLAYFICMKIYNKELPISNSKQNSENIINDIDAWSKQKADEDSEVVK